ncbi:response regulator [Sphingomonas quercus]|uniref:Response regulator n=1 Tax=Sphingomonas quercus TaxID=2842451 RepID=A0ABS6BM56_9SPHN|nr:response regulator [Sphingomonas quercus]MBU3079409.1 response regulator [Sphingomonas quercus]
MFSKRVRIIRKVLIVEDEPLVAFDNEHMLAEAGYEVVATVDRVVDALAVIAEQELDLVLADISLRGGGTGIDVAHAAANKGVRVLFVAGQCPSGTESYSVGCLGKPYAARDLMDALEVIEAIATGREPRRVPRALKLFV